MSFNPSTLTIPSGVSTSVPYPTLGLVPVEAFGAVGDAYQISDGAVNSGSNPTHLISAGSNFISFVGTKTVVVNGAGPVVNGLATDLVTTGVFSSTSLVILGGSASTTVSGATVSIGTDNTTAIQNALNSTLAPNLTIMNGLYLCGSGLVFPGRKNLFGSGGGRNAGILGAGSLYSLQANIPNDPIAGTGGTATISSATESTNTATYVLSASVPSWLTPGVYVQVSGMSVSGYNVIGKVLTAAGSSFTMTLPTSGLGSATGGTLTSLAGKKYALAASPTITDGSNALNLNIWACNPNTTVGWGVPWPDTGANNGMWEYNFTNCILSGWVGRHVMWCNGCTYTNCAFLGILAADAFTIPTGLTFVPTIQKMTDIGCEFSQEQTSFGSIHYESNQGGISGSLSVWKVVGGDFENGYGLGDFTGLGYALYNVHVERLLASLASLVINVPFGSTGTVVGPDLDVTGGQAGIITTAFNAAGTAPATWIWLSGSVGTNTVISQNIQGPAQTGTPTTFLQLNSTPTFYTRGIDMQLAPTGSSNFGAIFSLSGAGGTNTALELNASGATTNVSLNLQAGHIVSAGTSVLPTSDPHVVGQWWNNAGVVTVSAG